MTRCWSAAHGLGNTQGEYIGVFVSLWSQCEFEFERKDEKEKRKREVESEKNRGESEGGGGEDPLSTKH